MAYRIIVVYNEPDFRKWVRSLLNKTSYFEVAEQARGDEAIFLIAPTKPDAIISDEHRSEPDGIDVARYVHHQLPGVKVILVSPKEGHVHNKLYGEEGTLDFIPESEFSLDALLQTL